MYRNTRFQELMEGLPKKKFQQLVEELKADKYSKGFTCWDQLLSMIFAQLTGSESLRTLASRYNSQKHHHYHLQTKAIKRSTLADANQKKDSELYKRLCEQLIQQTHRDIKKECQEMLYLLDSTPIILKGYRYDGWSKENMTRFTQGLKVHVLYAAEDKQPVEAYITNPNVNDIEYGRDLEIAAKATYVFDKAYCDYNWWHRIDQQGAYFVTRLKVNAAVAVIEQKPIDTDSAILEDSIIKFTNKYPGGHRRNHYQQPLRRVTVQRDNGSTPIVLVSNDLTRSAEEIATLYKSRWDIELFFKWLKQNLKIKKFMGCSENAVRTQIYIALITYLLVGMYHKKQTEQDNLMIFLSVLSVTLFQRPKTDYHRYQKRKRERNELLKMQAVLPL